MASENATPHVGGLFNCQPFPISCDAMHYEQLGPHGQGLQAKEVLGADCTRGNRKHNITKFIMPFVKSKIYIIFIAFYVFSNLVSILKYFY
jgi:hypothetical protein